MTELEKQILDQITLDHAWSLIERFSTMVREHPDDVNAAAQVIVERLEALGVPVTVYDADLYLSLPKPSYVEAGGRRYEAKAPSMSAIALDGVTAPLVYVPSRRATGADDLFDTVSGDALRAADVRGKIVVTEGFAGPANTAEFEAAGAAGLIAVNPGVDVHWGTCTTIWGSPDLHDLPRKPKIPAVAVNRPDGEALIELARRGAEAKVVAVLEEGWYASKVPVVSIPGTEEPEKFVLLHGHYDSWDVGVGDNATGDATLLEIARVLWHNRQHLKRSVRIAWWPGHSTGRYAGSTWFADTFALDLDENCVAQVNCDSPGCRWATVYEGVSWMSEAEGFCQAVIRDVTGQDSSGEGHVLRAGDCSFNNLGVTTYFMLSSTMPEELLREKGYYPVGGCGGNIAWHTEDDTMEIADRDNLLRDMRVYATAVFRSLNAPIAPFDYRATVDELTAAVREYQDAAGDAFDFGESFAALEMLRGALDNFYSSLVVSEEGDVASLRRANAAQRAIGRTLVSLGYTRDGRFRQDPARAIPTLPDLAVARDLPNADEHTRHLIINSLVRGQNRLVWEVGQATQIATQAAR